MAERILIIQLNDLSAVLHAAAAVEALRRAQPEAHLAWLAHENYAEMLGAQPWLDEVIAWNHRSPRKVAWMLRQMRRVGWEIAIDFQGQLRSGLAARLSGARRRVGYLPSLEMAHLFYNECRPLETLNVHAVERNFALVEALGVSPPAPLARPYLERKPPAENEHTARWPALRPREKDIAAVEAWCAARRFDACRERLVILHPGCKRSSHRWPAARFTQLARRLLSVAGVRVALAGGSHAAALCDEIAEPLADDLWRAEGRFHPLALSELLSRAAVVVSGDSGVLHLAVASGAIVVGLYGSSDPVRSGPYSTSATVLVGQIGCSPCYQKTCPLGVDPPPCQQEISTDRVFAAVLSRLGQQAGQARKSA